jgi:multicomponent Na+:H+ antiporter subunit F
MLETVALVLLGWMGLLTGVSVALFFLATSTPVRMALIDLLVVQLVGALGLVAVAEDSASYLDAAGALVLLSFIATLAAARYHAEGRPL